MSITNLEYLRERDEHIYDAICDVNGYSKCVNCEENADCYECNLRNLKWLLEERKEPFLTESERQYLLAVIKPFRTRVEYILKEENIDSHTEFIHIELSDGDVADFPNFKANTMYKGMEIDKSYTLEELGL